VLHMDWTYSAAIHRPETVEAVGAQFLAALRALIAHCQTADAGGFTPSDFPLAALTQETVDQLVKVCPNTQDVYPLSPMQQGLLFHALSSTPGEYVYQLDYELSGTVDADLLEQMWQQVINRHPALRTSFFWKELEQPLQIVHRSVALPLERYDWRGLSPDEQQTQLDAFIEADRLRGFDLALAPLTRVALFRMSDERYHFLWSAHHLLLDGWSATLVSNEAFGALANARANSAAVDGRRPYRDYIEWLKKRDFAASERFWRQALKGFTSPTPLRFGSPPASTPASIDTSEECLLVPQATTASLRAFARERQLTLNTLVEGAWALLLGRASERNDVLYGSIVAGRPPELPGSESMVGLFINTLPRRVRIQSEMPMLAWLSALQQQQLDERDHEHTPLTSILKWSDIPRPLPLFESLVVFENYPADEPLLSQAPFRIGEIRPFIKNSYPLTLRAMPGPRLALLAMYARQRFEKAAMSRLLEQLRFVLEQFATQPTETVEKLYEALDAADRRRTTVMVEKSAAASLSKLRSARRTIAKGGVSNDGTATF
jgi:hypothetical protein